MTHLAHKLHKKSIAQSIGPLYCAYICYSILLQSILPNPYFSGEHCLIFLKIWYASFTEPDPYKSNKYNDDPTQGVDKWEERRGSWLYCLCLGSKYDGIL